jgi:hypothetical protein
MRRILYLAALYVIIAALFGFWPFKDSVIKMLFRAWEFADRTF